MPSLAAFTSPTAWHILSYGTLLGTSIFNSFFAGIISFKVLPRSSFSVLQQNLFPYYFSMQTILPLTTLISFPVSSLPLLTESNNLWDVTAPLATMAVLGATNWLFIGPWTTKVMRERKQQETRDGKKYFDQGTQSEEMKRLNKTFGTLHGVSSLVNLAEILVTIYYGFVLAGRATVSS